MRRATLASAAVGVACVAVSAAVYRRVLDSYFWSDDFVWLWLIVDAPLAEVLFTPIGGHAWVARNAIFVALHALAGLDPRPYFASALVTHLVNVVLLYRLALALGEGVALAGLAALVWGTSIAAAEPLAWYSVYGEVAATTCVLLVLDLLVRRGRAGRSMAPRDVLVSALLLTVGSQLFTSALATAVIFPAVVALLGPPSAEWRRALAVPLAALLVYASVHLVASHVYGAPAVGVEVLRWLVHRPLAAVAALAHLVRVGLASLVLGPWWRPADSADVVSWLVAGGVVVVCALAVTIAPPPRRRQIAAFALLAGATYAAVAAGRGPTAGPFFGFTAAQVGATLRYHYSAHAHLALMVVLSLAALRGRLTAVRVVPPLWAALILLGLVRHGVPIDLHAGARAEVEGALAAMRARIAAASPGETVVMESRMLASFGWLPNTRIQPPGWATLFVIAWPGDVVDGRTVRFIEPHGPTYQLFAARSGSRLAAVLVPADTVR